MDIWIPWTQLHTMRTRTCVWVCPKDASLAVADMSQRTGSITVFEMISLRRMNLPLHLIYFYRSIVFSAPFITFYSSIKIAVVTYLKIPLRGI